jgi:hypothetical protein
MKKKRFLAKKMKNDNLLYIGRLKAYNTNLHTDCMASFLTTLNQKNTISTKPSKQSITKTLCNLSIRQQRTPVFKHANPTT